MKKLTKKQLEIYNWLLDHPGYLKKGSTFIYRYVFSGGSHKDVEVALREARLYNKNSKITSNILEEDNPLDWVWVNGELAGIDYTPTKERNTPGTYFVTGCTHAPWHNKQMYKSVFNYLAKENISLQGLILAGDFLDLNSLSSHDKGKKPIQGVTLDWEYREANKFLDEFDSLKYNKGATKDFIGGNHEDRYLRLLRNNDESKYGTALKSPEEGLNLIKRGYNVYTDWKNDWISIGKHLEVGHGEFCSTHVSKKMIDTFRKSVVFFHTHREQLYIEGNVGGFNMGSGADFDAPIFGYATRAMKNSWVNACCLVHLDSEGFFHIQTLRYFNNKLIVNGREY